MAFLVVAGSGVFLVYRQLEGNLDSVDAFADIVPERPSTAPGAQDALNILVIGDDHLGEDPRAAEVGRSDTTILLHVSGDRSHAYAVSVPRDVMVDRPACRSKDDPGEVVSAQEAVIWNEAYSLGGPACTLAQFEQMTDVRVDHFAVLRLAAVEDVVDSLGGVEICVPERVTSHGTELLPAGRYVATGEQARSYVQVRKQLGDGSDLDRTRRQQVFLSTLFDRVTSTGTLTDPKKLYALLDASTSAVVTDPALSDLSSLAQLALQLRRLRADDVRFLTMPVAPFVRDPDRLDVGVEADRLWTRVRNDRPLPPEVSPTTVTGGADPGDGCQDPKG